MKHALAAKAVVGVAAVVAVNAFWGRRALNNFALDQAWDWGKEVVLITGGSSGLGELVARKLGARGIRVAVLDLKPPPTAFPAGISFYQADVTSSAAMHDVAVRVRAEMGDPTVLINNAGIAAGAGRSILAEPEQEIRRTVDVNLVAHFITVKEFLPAMIRNDHGHVVTIASVASFITLAGLVDYCCSKAGVLAFHDGLRQELRHWYRAPHVRTSIIHPTWTRTPLLEPILGLTNFNDRVIEADFVATAIVDQVLSGRSGQVTLPRSTGWLLAAARFLPDWVQERVIRDSRAGLLHPLGI